jgi:acyl-CoA thioester hydrolase
VPLASELVTSFPFSDPPTLLSSCPMSSISSITWRVNYSETDQMGVVYHACYLVWLDRARTEHLRRTGMSYADLERLGFRLTVGEARIRYRQPARYDDEVRVRCWVRDLASRRIVFGYAVDHVAEDRLLATAETSLMVLDAGFKWTRLPPEVMARLPVSPDPVRL